LKQRSGRRGTDTNTGAGAATIVLVQRHAAEQATVHVEEELESDLFWPMDRDVVFFFILLFL
jgi:hypothetical protein